MDSLIVMECVVTKGNLHDSKVAHSLIDSLRNFSYIIADSAYDSSEIYDYIFKNTHAIPIIDTNRRRNITSKRLKVNRRIGMEMRKIYAPIYSLRWEIERTFSILEEIMKCEYIYYVKNRDYDRAIGLKILSYNLMVISNMKIGERPREIMKITVS